MRTKTIFKLLSLVIITMNAISCIDEIPLETESFESVLVIEATITNEDIQQEILLSRSNRLDSIPVKESGATVIVTDDVFNTFTFIEESSGKYVSQNPFSAQPNRNYRLSISTSDGRQYRSSEMQLTQATTIDDIYVERGFNENGIEGVSIFIDSFDPTGNSKFYRHEYEETYKVIAPLYSAEEMIPNDIDFPLLPEEQPVINSGQELIDFLVTTQLREEQVQICYNTIKSNDILLANTIELNEDRLDKHRVRFIGRDNPEIIHRYSLLVRQYVQSIESYRFYETLKTQSISESVFSDTQPGFLIGNMISDTDADERVIGFFEVASVDSKRVFFNYTDLFPGEELPPFYITCDFYIPDLLTVDPLSGIWTGSPLIQALNDGYQYYNDFSLSIHTVVYQECGNCTFRGENVVPDFWEE